MVYSPHIELNHVESHTFWTFGPHIRSHHITSELSAIPSSAIRLTLPPSPSSLEKCDRDPPPDERGQPRGNDPVLGVRRGPPGHGVAWRTVRRRGARGGVSGVSLGACGVLGRDGTKVHGVSLELKGPPDPTFPGAHELLICFIESKLKSRAMPFWMFGQV